MVSLARYPRDRKIWLGELIWATSLSVIASDWSQQIQSLNSEVIKSKHLNKAEFPSCEVRMHPLHWKDSSGYVTGSLTSFSSLSGTQKGVKFSSIACKYWWNWKCLLTETYWNWKAYQVSLGIYASSAQLWEYILGLDYEQVTNLSLCGGCVLPFEGRREHKQQAEVQHSGVNQFWCNFMHVSKITLGPGSICAEYVTEFIVVSYRKNEMFLW